MGEDKEKQFGQSGSGDVFVLAIYVNGARICCAFRKLDWDVSNGRLKNISGENLGWDEYLFLRGNAYPDLEFLRLDFTKIEKIDCICPLETLEIIRSKASSGITRFDIVNRHPKSS